MYPILFRYGFLTIHTYGLFIAMAFYVCISLSAHTAQKNGIDPSIIMDLGLYIIISAIVGSRLFFVIGNYEKYINSPLDAFKVWEGGLVFYGGLILVIPVVILYLKKHSVPILKCMDVFAPYVSLGHSIGRIGCFFAGCCYGSPTNLPWAVVYKDQNSLAPLNVSFHPTQIYSSILNFSLFLILRWMYKKIKFDGQIFSLYLILYPINRFIVEIFRSDPRGDITIGSIVLSTSQFISIFGFIGGMVGYLGKIVAERWHKYLKEKSKDICK